MRRRQSGQVKRYDKFEANTRFYVAGEPGIRVFGQPTIPSEQLAALLVAMGLRAVALTDFT
jgi:hypothetical protein